MSFVPQTVVGSSADGDYVYYNATIVNNNVDPSVRRADPELVFQDTRQFPIIKDSSKYVVSVDNFTLNGPQKNIPLWIPSIKKGTDVNLTTYTITFGLYLYNVTGGVPIPDDGVRSNYWVQATIPLTWTPENALALSAPVPATATPRQQETPYYYGYTYDHFLTILNNALTAAWRDVIYKFDAYAAANPGDAVDPAGTKCPFFEFDPKTGLFSLCQDGNTSWLPFGTVARADGEVYDGPAGVSDPFEPYVPFGVSTATGYNIGEFSYVGMNANLEALLTNFNTIYYGPSAATLYDYAINPGFATECPGFEYGSPGPTIVFPIYPTSTVTAPSAVVWNEGQPGPLGAAAGGPYLPEFVFNVIPNNKPDSVFTLLSPYPATNQVDLYYIRELQNYISTGSIWTPVSSLVLVTNSMPVRFEQNASPVQLGNSNVGTETQTSGASQKVLLEVPINAITADQWRGFIDYKPLVPLFSALDAVQDGLTTVDVRLCWRSRLTNSLIPVKMYNGSTFTLRLRFVRKG